MDEKMVKVWSIRKLIRAPDFTLSQFWNRIFWLCWV